MANRFTFFQSYYESLKELCPEDFKAVVCAMCAFAFYGEDSELTGIQKAIYALIKPNVEKSLELVERRKEAGRRGAEAKVKQMGSKQSAKVSKQVANSQQAGSGVGEGVGVGERKKEIGNTNKARYSDSPELDEAIRLFIEHRKKLKKPMTDHAIDLFLKRLEKLADTTEGRIEIINEAIRRGWLDVYPVKGNKDTKDTMSVVDGWLGGSGE